MNARAVLILKYINECGGDANTQDGDEYGV